MSAKVHGVHRTRAANFFSPENWRAGFAWHGMFIGHWDVGFFTIGPDHLTRRRFAVSGGLWPRPDAKPGEIIWRWWFRWSPDFPRLIYAYDRPVGSGAWLSRRWTGRDVRVIGWHWRGTNYVPWA